MGKNVTDMGQEKITTKHELKKHAATIHCSNTLSLLQRKISNALLYHAYKELMLKDEHEITIKELCRLISYSGHNHAVIKDALKGMLSTVIEWNVVNDVTGTEDWTASSMLASVCLRGPICLYAYSPRMKALLHSPSMFGKINLFIQSRFKSSYGLALYENCIRYRGLASTKWLDIETFRKLMGVPMDKYPIFRDFKRRVLDKSVEEVNTYSDLFVEPEIAREGRQVARIRFTLKERAKKVRLGKLSHEEASQIEVLADIDHVVPTDELAGKLIGEYGLSSVQVQQVMREYSLEFINDKITVIESSKNFQQGKVQNLPAYFMSALKHDYQSSKTLPIAQMEIMQLGKGALSKKIESAAKKIRKTYMAYRENEIDQAIQRLAKNEQDKFMNYFKSEAADAIHIILKLQRKKYNQETIMDSPQIKALMRHYAFRQLPGLNEKIISLEQFVGGLPEKSRSAWDELVRFDPDHELLK